MRAFATLIAVLAAIWLLGAAAQGILFGASLTTRRIWLFTWWFEKFAFGMVVGFVLGAVVTWFALHKRPRWPGSRRDADGGREHAERTEEELAALREELASRSER